MNKTKPFLFVLLMLYAIASNGQTAVDKDLAFYINGLKKEKVTTWIVVEQGCIGCEVVRNDKAISDSKTYYVISKKPSNYRLHRIDGFGKYSPIEIDTLSVFSLLDQNINAFKKKDAYLLETAKASKTLKFVPPRPIHYSYTYLTVNSPDLKSDLKIIDEEFDNSGYMISNKEWFSTISQITDFVISVVSAQIK